MFGLALISTIVGTYSPLNINILLGLTVMLFPICGIIGGFSSGRLYAFFHGTDFLMLWLANGLFFPFLVAVGLIIIDICEFEETGKIHTLALSEGIIFSGLLLLVNIPMNFIGCFFGYKVKAI